MQHRFLKKEIALTTLITLFLSIITALPASGTTDSLVMKNGEQLYGKIKALDRNVLTFSTAYSSSDFKIKWQEVAEVYSSRMFLVTDASGERYYGTIKTDTASHNHVLVGSGSEMVLVPVEQVVYIRPVIKDFRSRFDASLSVGFNLAKANNLRQFTIRSNFGYDAERWNYKMGFNMVRSAQQDAKNVRRTDATAGVQYFLPKDWFVLASSDFLQNDEQNLKLRITASGGVGKYLIHTNRTTLTLAAGAAWNNETYTEAGLGTRNSAEGYGGIDLNIFSMGDLSLHSIVSVYPGITEQGRIRGDFKLDVKYNLPLDFFVKAGTTFNYDNQPVAGAPETDYVVQATFGWEL
jgi:putative salt-induced outer membrane protein YdiY